MRGWAAGLMPLMLLGCVSWPGCHRSDGPTVVLEGRGGKPVRVRIEIARRPEQLSRGLKYRQSLPEDAGMLFIYPADGHRRFWMQDTYIPLDMVFIGDNRRIVGVVENTEPLTEEGREVDAPSRFVLEVNAGFLKRHGVRPGSAVEIEGVEGLD
ncbi:MAG: DUF192 domain-containing protein [Deltaproteobacteria bacterium]|nr:DUF192 domain-containing protein [Deltaproteobacteria bacterium]